MNAFKKLRKRRKISLSIESVAMTDVVFLLLIFFMLSTTFVSLNSGIKVNLPTGGIKKIDVDENINLKITKNGDIFYHGRAINKNFDKIIGAALDKSVSKTVVIAADKDVLHGTVVDVMNKVLKLGGKKIAIATKTPDEEE
jgi:biopolymer transport protein ExbD